MVGGGESVLSEYEVVEVDLAGVVVGYFVFGRVSACFVVEDDDGVVSRSKQVVDAAT